MLWERKYVKIFFQVKYDLWNNLFNSKLYCHTFMVHFRIGRTNLISDKKVFKQHFKVHLLEPVWRKCILTRDVVRFSNLGGQSPISNAVGKYIKERGLTADDVTLRPWLPVNIFWWQVWSDSATQTNYNSICFFTTKLSSPAISI